MEIIVVLTKSIKTILEHQVSLIGIHVPFCSINWLTSAVWVGPALIHVLVYWMYPWPCSCECLVCANVVELPDLGIKCYWDRACIKIKKSGQCRHGYSPLEWDWTGWLNYRRNRLVKFRVNITLNIKLFPLTPALYVTHEDL